MGCGGPGQAWRTWARARQAGDDAGHLGWASGNRRAAAARGVAWARHTASRLRHPVQDLGRGRGVVVVRAGLHAFHQDAGVEGAADDDRHAARGAAGQEAVQGRLLQQGVAAGQQEDVELGFIEGRVADLPLVDAQADGVDRAAVAQGAHGLVAALEELAPPQGVVGAVGGRAQVVGQQDVDVVAVQALQAGLEGPHHAVVAVVEHRLEGGGGDEAVPLGQGSAWAREAHQAPADLGRDLGRGRKGRAQPAFAEAEAVVRRGVEIGDPLGQGRPRSSRARPRR